MRCILVLVPLLLWTGCESAQPVPELSYAAPVVLDARPQRSANAEIADYDGDGFLDIALAVGRHWPGANKVYFGDGKGNFPRVDSLAQPPDRTYSLSAVDMDLDGDLDLVVSNDRPDPNYILFNDGSGHFDQRQDVGDPQWPTRNSTVADINSDGRPDIVVANRSGDPRPESREGGSPPPGDNHLCLNRPTGMGIRMDCSPLSSGSATTISIADLNSDGFLDLVVPYRDGGQSQVLVGDGSGIANITVPFGPPDASFRAALAVDVNGDDLLDLVAISDKARETTYYLQQTPFAFSEGYRLDSGEFIPYALAIADLDADGRDDILVGYREIASRLFLAREAGFEEIALGNDEGSAYGFDTGDINQDGMLDIVLARSGASDVLFLSRTRE